METRSLQHDAPSEEPVSPDLLSFLQCVDVSHDQGRTRTVASELFSTADRLTDGTS